MGHGVSNARVRHVDVLGRRLAERGPRDLDGDVAIEIVRLDVLLHQLLNRPLQRQPKAEGAVGRLAVAVADNELDEAELEALRPDLEAVIEVAQRLLRRRGPVALGGAS